MNVHSSGDATKSFLNAKIEMAIPAGGTVTISRGDGDVGVNIEQIIVGDGELGLPPDIWNLPPLPVAAGPYPADWKGLAAKYATPEWWRDAKFGAWAHWDPQSMPEQGDWYARGMYQEGSAQYQLPPPALRPSVGIRLQGHCPQLGDRPVEARRTDGLIRRNGGEILHGHGRSPRQFRLLGFDLPAVELGERRTQGGHRRHMGKSGAGQGNEVSASVFTTRRGGPGASSCRCGTPATSGAPGRACHTMRCRRFWTARENGGRGWIRWISMARCTSVKDPLHSPFANQFMWRVDDAITKYHPDVIYFDEHAGDSQVDLGVHMGLGFLAPPLVANYYNKSLAWNHGKMEVVINLKGVGGRYNSFQNSPELLPFVDRSLVKSTEAIIESQIQAYPFQTETSIADWHYKTGQRYIDARRLVRSLMQNVSRNGTMLLNLTQHGRGDLDPEVIQIAKDIGAWLKINGEAVYASRPFEVFGDNAVCYTRNNGNVYATLLDWNGGPITLKALHAGGATLGKVSKVELLGSDVPLTFVQDDQGLTVTPSGAAQPLAGITNQALGWAVPRAAHHP